jgi:hypothetical protein
VSLTIVLFVVVVIALALALLILWDRLVGTALVGTAAGATWLVARSAGRWWFWPVVVVAALVLIAAFVIAVLVS